ncbi:hypothetical protein ACFL3T_05460 [Patescibacteria group bacterium]
MLDVPDEREVLIEREHEFPTSVYATLKTDDRLFVGGSTWNRREDPYNEETRNSGGLVRILDSNGKELNSFELPSMVYSILQIRGGYYVACCKGSKQTLVMFDRDGDIQMTTDDEDGEGIYNALLITDKKNIVCTTRTGKLKSFDPMFLHEKGSVPLAGPDTRLWSVAYNEHTDIVYSGDYDGYLYKTERIGTINSIDLKKERPIPEGMDPNFGPSVWGIEIMPNGNLLVGTRWGTIFHVNKDLTVLGEIMVKEKIDHPAESVTSLCRISGYVFLVGTRQGKLFSYDAVTHKFVLISEDPPALEKENAIWGINCHKDGFATVAVADGKVYEVSLS